MKTNTPPPRTPIWLRGTIVNLLALVAGIAIGNAALASQIPSEAEELAGCRPTGCLSCVLDNCPLLEEGWWRVAVSSDWVLRCVEYDQVPPPHCA